MRKIFKIMAFLAILLPLMVSCSGGSDSESVIFGKFPSVYEKFLTEKTKLEEERKNIKTEAEKAEYLKKVEKLKAKWTEKLQTAAKSADNQTLEFAESNVKIIDPISLTFEKLDNDLKPVYTINGKAEAASEINSKISVFHLVSVNLCGYDEAGNEVFCNKVGNVKSTQDNDRLVPAGTPVNFSQLYFSSKEVEGYIKAKTLKLVIDEAEANN